MSLSGYRPKYSIDISKLMPPQGGTGESSSSKLFDCPNCGAKNQKEECIYCGTEYEMS
jgi:hypothetical protein